MPVSQTSFSERLARIESGSYTHYVDPETGMQIPRRAKAPRRKGPPKTEGLRHTLSFVAAMLAGALGILAARYVRYQYFGLADGAEGAMADGLMVMDLIFGCIAAMMVKVLFRMGGKEFIVFQTAGALAALTLMHNLVWMYPEPFAEVFGPEWVEYTQSTTEPASVYFRGMTIPLTTS